MLFKQPSAVGEGVGGREELLVLAPALPICHPTARALGKVGMKITQLYRLYQGYSAFAPEHHSVFYGVFLPCIRRGPNSPHSSPYPACVGFMHTVLLICMKVPGYGSETARHLIFEEISRPFEFTVVAVIIV